MGSDAVGDEGSGGFSHLFCIPDHKGKKTQITPIDHVGTLPDGYIKSSPLSRVNPRPRVNTRLKVSPKVPMDTSPTYRAQLALQAVTATQWQLISRTKHLAIANRLVMVIP